MMRSEIANATPSTKDEYSWPLDANNEPILTEAQSAYFREKWNEALEEDGPYTPIEEVFDRLHARYQAKIDEAKK